MNVVLRLLCVGVLVLASSCTEFLQFLVDSAGPSGVTATTGRGESIEVSWSEPSSSDDKKVSSYTIERDGFEVGASFDTSWTDDTALPATGYRYAVYATFDDGSTSGTGKEVTGWYVPAEDLRLGTDPGTISAPGSHFTSDGWFETIVVEGWKYHLDIVGAANADLWICDDEKPWVQMPLGTSTAFTWTSDRTGRVWVKVAPAETVDAWYE